MIAPYATYCNCVHTSPVLTEARGAPPEIPEDTARELPQSKPPPTTLSGSIPGEPGPAKRREPTTGSPGPRDPTDQQGPSRFSQVPRPYLPPRHTPVHFF
ncbi:hypothetical protein CRENBAI_000534 [Crenichthys baileyi]|uniref:Uncharacterized protein n=1 Tax=Crenichthys baileyi TaxID=28760 RepID=A0AAV9RHA5_9TELE